MGGKLECGTGALALLLLLQACGTDSASEAGSDGSSSGAAGTSSSTSNGVTTPGPGSGEGSTAGTSDPSSSTAGSGSSSGEEGSTTSGAAICVIDGMTYQAGDVAEGSPCELCDPKVADDDWSNARDGGRCGDGGACLAGVCDCPAAELPCAEGCATEVFDTTYTLYDPDGDGPVPATTYNIRITAPTEPGDYPIAIILAGTSGTDGSLALGPLADRLATAGIVAAQVGYNNETSSGCGCDGMGIGGPNCGPAKTYFNKAQAIFDPEAVESAVSEIVAATAGRPARAVIERGVVVSGWSQGTVVARQAGNWLDAYVRAGYMLGSGNRPRGGPACGRQDWYCNQDDHPGVVPADRIRFFTGEQDVYFSEAQDDAASCGELTAASTREQLVQLSGCDQAGDVCELPSGAGHRVVRNGDVDDGTADHNFFSGDSGWNTDSTEIDPLPWSLGETVLWVRAQIAASACI